MVDEREVEPSEAAVYGLLSYGISSSLLYSMVLTGRMTKAEAGIVLNGALTGIKGMCEDRSVPAAVLQSALDSVEAMRGVIDRLPVRRGKS